MTAQKSPSILDPMLCFSVYALDRQIGRIYQELLAPWKLSYTQYLVLLLLEEGASPTVSGLGEKLDLDSGTLSPLLSRLETRGLLVRARAAADGRIVTVSLTEAGAELRSQLGEVQRCLIERMPMTAEEATDLLQRLRTISTRLAAA